MINHQSSLSVQMAGSACFYHLLRLQRAKALTNDELRQCINRCLDASEHHPRMAQVIRHPKSEFGNFEILILVTKECMVNIM